MVISLKKLFPLKKSELTLLFMVIILLSLSNILPYFFQDSINRGFPLHNDELFHLNQAKHLRSGSYEFILTIFSFLLSLKKTTMVL